MDTKCLNREYVCSNCGTSIEAPEVVPRAPCKKCGSYARTINQAVYESIHAEAYLKTHAKHRDGGKKILREVIAGDDYHRLTGRWNYIYRSFDRINDWYEERFVDRHSGKIIHQKAEPLSQHRNIPKRR